MNKMIHALLVLSLSACSARGKYVHHHINNMAYGAAMATTACDWGQTRKAASMDWNNGRWYEDNAILGSQPSETKVDIYMASVLIGLTVSKKVLPEWAQSVLYAGTIAFETKTIVENTMVGVPGMCGLEQGSSMESSIPKK